MAKNLKLEEPKADDPLREEKLLFNDFMRENYNSGGWYHFSDLKKTETGKRITELNREGLANIIHIVLTKLLGRLSEKEADLLEEFYSVLIKKKLPLSEETTIQLCKYFLNSDSDYFWHSPMLEVKAIKNYFENNDPSDILLVEITAVHEMLKKKNQDAEFRKAALLLDDLIGKSPTIFIEPGEAWSDCALSDLNSFSIENRTNWEKLISHAQTATGGKPNTKWLKEANSLLDVVSWGEFQSTLLKWFPLVDKPRTSPRTKEYAWEPDLESTILDHHADLLKGLAWMAGMKEDAQLARAIANLALSSYKKIPGIGPRLIKVGNACVYSLGAMPGDASLGQLAFLKVKVKFGTAQKGIEKALNVTAERVGISRDELEEISVPEYGFTTVGERLETLREFTARLRLLNNGKTDLKWIKQDGKEQKSVPAAVKSDFPEELKELKTIAKDITRMHSAQRDRLDGMFLKCKEWKLDIWKERYLDHPLLGTLTRRLIWTVKDNQDTYAVFWLEDQLVDINDQPITPSDDALIEPWHPVGHTVEEITQWRDWLVRHEIQQPFKQAHREVYLLTDAERNTKTYSNRFAAHIVKQHQFNALCGQRGWKNSLRLLVDAEYLPPTINLPEWNLRAEYWVDGAGDEYGVDTNDSGTFLYLATDQVRFYSIDADEHHVHAGGGGYRTGSDEPMEVESVPPLVFSEILRDVDLFVGVASVGNDQNWADGGAEGRYYEYWQTYSFGELSATARTRKEVLEKLIPRLKIADQCSLEDRFLTVQGEIRTYKIHLGSGNILMEPNDQYLCIVPSSKSATPGKVFLPFDGDRTLSIILSKALLLADDKKIKDPTIISQIQPR